MAWMADPVAMSSKPGLWNLPEEFHRAAWKNIPMQLRPECLSGSSATAIIAVLQGPPQSSM